MTEHKTHQEIVLLGGTVRGASPDELRELGSQAAAAIGSEYITRTLHPPEAFDPVEDKLRQLLEAAEARYQRLLSKVARYGIEELEFDVRIYNNLKRNGVDTIGGLASKTEVGLLDQPNFGVGSLAKVKATLDEWGIELRSEPATETE